MAVGPFITHDAGMLQLLRGTQDFHEGTLYAVLATTSETPDATSQIDYEDILAEVAGGGDYDQIAVPSPTITTESGGFQMFDCGTLTFTASGDITARYLYILFGDTTPAAGDVILGHIDLTGSGNASSVDGEFSFTPHANGLFRIARSAAP